MYEQTSQGHRMLETKPESMVPCGDRRMQDCRVWFTTRTDVQKDEVDIFCMIHAQSATIYH